MPRTLVTSALPYANGPVHLGHLIGAYLPADCYVRTLRALGEEVLFVCGADEHGVAITIGAEKEGLPYPDYVRRWRDEIKASFDAFGIAFDVWSGTSVCPEHAETSQAFFRRLDQNGYLEKRAEEQLYCEQDRMFLADRYVQGTCPECGYEEARGDECPRCGKWLDPLRMPRVRCKVCGTPPVRRRTAHWYLDLPRLRDDGFGAWFEGHAWKPNVRAFIGNQLAEIRPRPITRDMRWGVPVPADRAGGEQGKVLYVWFDAPIGYISFTKQWARERGKPEDWKRWWLEAGTRLVHFIGKDNIPFHCLVFPSMLFGMKEGWNLPWQVPAHEFYNLEGRKFNTTKNWTLPLGPLTQRYDVDVLRFHLLASAPETADSEWRWDEFQRGVNSALADTLGNLVTRVLRLAHKNFDGRVPPLEPALEPELDRVLLQECGPLADPARSVLDFRFRRATEELVANGTVGNLFLNDLAPWSLLKSGKSADRLRAAAVLNTGCNWIALLARWLTPFLPRKSQELWAMVGGSGRVDAQPWPGIPRPGAWRSIPPGTPFGEIAGPFPRITDDQIAAELEALRARAAEVSVEP